MNLAAYTSRDLRVLLATLKPGEDRAVIEAELRRRERQRDGRPQGAPQNGED